MLFIFAEYFLQINYISLDALLRNSEQIKLSEFLKRNKNLTFLRNTWCSTGSIPNIIWHWSVTSRDLVRKIFIKTRVTAKDTELWSRARNGQASVAYKSTGRHLEDISYIYLSIYLSIYHLPYICYKIRLHEWLHCQENEKSNYFKISNRCSIKYTSR